MNISWIKAIVALCAVAVLSACGPAGSREIPTTGHISDGVYILPPEEQQYTCQEFDGAIRYSVRQAFEKVGEGNKAAILTTVGNLVSFGLGGIPRGIHFGGAERFEGRQELTKALTLDAAAKANGCDGVDVPALVDAELGEGSLARVVEDRQGEGPLAAILQEEQELKTRIR